MDKETMIKIYDFLKEIGYELSSIDSNGTWLEISAKKEIDMEAIKAMSPPPKDSNPFIKK